MIPLVALGNVVLPLLAAPYVPAFVNPLVWLAVVALETAVVFAVAQRPGIVRILGMVAIANLVSWMVGVVLAWYLPDGSNRAGMISEFNYHAVAPEAVQRLGFVLAFVLSVAIESLVVALLSRRRPFPRRFLAVLLANAASYSAIAAIPWRMPW